MIKLWAYLSMLRLKFQVRMIQFKLSVLTWQVDRLSKKAVSKVTKIIGSDKS